MFTYTPLSAEGVARGAPVARDLSDHRRRQGDNSRHQRVGGPFSGNRRWRAFPGPRHFTTACGFELLDRHCASGVATEGGHREGATRRTEPLEQEELDPPRAHVALPRPGRADISQYADDFFCVEMGVKRISLGRIPAAQSLARIVFGRLACQILCREICAATQQRPNHLGVVRTGSGAHQRRRRVAALIIYSLRSNAYARIAAAIKQGAHNGGVVPPRGSV